MADDPLITPADFRARRLEAGCTLEDVARQAGYHRTHIYNIEQGIRGWNHHNVDVLLQALERAIEVRLEARAAQSSTLERIDEKIAQLQRRNA